MVASRPDMLWVSRSLWERLEAIEADFYYYVLTDTGTVSFVSRSLGILREEAINWLLAETQERLRAVALVVNYEIVAVHSGSVRNVLTDVVARFREEFFID